jgi:TM2 domain-containing membrane protein YozV
MNANALTKVEAEIRDDILYGRLAQAEQKWQWAASQGATLPPFETMREQVKAWATEESDRRRQMAMMPKPKNPGIAAVLSFLFAGLGQVYNGQIGKGIVLLVFYGLSILSMAILVGFLTTPLLWLFGMVDAYKTAERINRDATRAAFGPF